MLQINQQILLEVLEETNTTRGTTTNRHTGHITTRYMICHPSVCISRNSGGSSKLPDDGRLVPKHVGANT
jgi:hypothetical protein